MSELSDVIREMKEEKRLRAGMSVVYPGSNSAGAADARRLAVHYGVSPALVEADPETFKQQEMRDLAEGMFDALPWTVNHLSDDPNTANLFTKEDFPKLRHMSDILGMAKSSEQGRLGSPLLLQPKPKADFRNVLLGSASRVLGVVFPALGGVMAQRAAGRFGEDLRQDMVESGLTAPQYAGRWAKALPNAVPLAIADTAHGALGVSEMVTSNTVGRIAGEDPLFNWYREQDQIALATEKLYTPEWMKSNFEKGVFSGARSLTGMLLMAPLGGRALLGLAGQTTGLAFTKYRDRGVDTTAATLGALAEGGIEYLTEKRFGGYGTGSFNVAGTLVNPTLSKLGRYIWREQIGEQAATLGQDLTDFLVPGSETKSWGQFFNERPAAAIQTFWAVTAMGGAVGATGYARKAFSRITDNHSDAVEGLHGQATLEGLMNEAADTPLRKASAEAFASFVEAGAKNSPVKNVFVPVSAIDAVMADETIPDEEKAALTVYQSQIEEARVNNGEVVIPIGEALATLSGTKTWEVIKDDARVLSGGLSGREAREHMDKLIEELDAVGNAAVAEAQGAEPSIEAKRAVYDDVKVQVIAAGRSEREAQTTAALVASRAETLASARYGKFEDAQAAYKWMQLEIAKTQPKGGRKVAQSVEGVYEEARRNDQGGAGQAVAEAAGRTDEAGGSGQSLPPRGLLARHLGRFEGVRALALQSTPAFRRAGGRVDARGNERSSVAQFVPTEAFTQSLAEAPTAFDEITSPEVFAAAIVAAKEALGPVGDAVYVYPTEDYAGMRLFVSPDGLTGFAIKPDGDLVSVFSAARGRSGAIMELAIQEGATKLDAFDIGGFLPSLYSAHGFTETSRDTWNEEYAPEGWNYEINGRPDVVYMVLDRASLTEPVRFNQSDLTPLEAVASAAGALEVAKSQLFPTMRDFKLRLQDMVKATKVGNLRDAKRLTRLALADARLALQNNKNAIGWYGEKMEEAMSVLGAIHPEINTDADARFAFIYALSVTSQGLKVERNFKLADIVYREFKKTGKMPEHIGEGTSKKIMQNSLALFNRLTEQLGSSAKLREFMLAEHTVGEIEKTLGITVSGEHKGTKVKGAALLGPKIGNGYFSNLYGDFTQLTMDRWFIRTWGRWTGSLVVVDKATVKRHTTRLTTLVRDLSPAQRKAVEQLLSTAKKAFKIRLGDIEGLAKRISMASTSADVRAQLAEIHPRLRLDAMALAKTADGQKEAPQGPAERNEIRAIMGPVLTELQQDYPDLTMADLQAVLWYPEKKLYDTSKQKVGIEAKVGYENEEAPDYANAAVALARGAGVNEEKINAAVARARGRVSASKRTGRAGRADRGSARVAEDENGFPLEEGLSSEGDGTTDPTVYQQFGGPVGAINDIRTMSLLEQAFQLEGTLTEEEVWEQTGWIKGAEGQWRFEIDDSAATLGNMPSDEFISVDDVNYSYLSEPFAPGTLRGEQGAIEGRRLVEVLQHPKLFKFYPQLEDLPVFAMDMPSNEKGFYDFHKIVINSADSPDVQLSTILHELQHAIQGIEGFANGATPMPDLMRQAGYGAELDAYIDYYRAIARGEIPGKSAPPNWDGSDAGLIAAAAYTVYHRTAGETEARNVQKRQKLSAKQRLLQFPDITADYKRTEVFLPVEQMQMAAASSTGPAPPRGETAFFPGGRTVVSLFKADFSTMVHELSHVFLDQELRLAAEPGATPELKADVARLKKWFADHGAPIGEDGKIPVEAHELFARTGERYFRTGKAPSAELRATFKQFRQWLTGVYRTVKDLLAYGPAPINPEISQIFDRIIATQEAIDYSSTQPMSQEELGMTAAEYEAYLESTKAAHDRAYDTLLERMMKAIRQREDKAIKAQRANVRADVAEEVNKDPRFIALHLLRTGRWLGDPNRERTAVKINTGWLIDNFGEEILAQLPVGLQPLHRGDGVPGDDIAELVGMPSGDALVKALVDLKDQADALKAEGNPRPLRDQIIEDRTDEIMAERHGDIAMSEAEIEEEAIAALNSNRQGEVLATELRQLKKKSAQPGVVTPYQILREWARRKANEGTVKEAASKETLRRYIRLFNKARTAFENAILGGKTDEAIKQKQAQMINHALLAESKKVADEINTIVRRMKRYAKTKALASIDQDYMDRIHELLEGYNFRTVSLRAREEQAAFEEWAAGQREQGHEVYIPPRFRDNRVNWEDAQVAKLLELNDMVTSLASLGKMKQRLITAEQERALAEVLDETEGAILNLPERKRGDFSTGEETQPFFQSWREAKTFAEYRTAIGNLFKRTTMREFASGLVKIEGMADILDGNAMGTGPLNRVLIQGATDAANLYSQMTDEILEPIIKTYKGMSGKLARRMGDKVTISELTLNVSIHPDDAEKLGQPLSISRRKLLGLVANTGNLSNLSKMVAGEKWGDPESMVDMKRVQQILISYLNKEEMDLVQAAWDGIGKLWPHIVRVEREMTGIVPEEVTPMDFETPWGTYSGGYWPVVYDRDRSELGRFQGEASEESMMGSVFGVATPKGHTITRTNAVGPMEMSFENVLFGHTTKVMSRIAYAPWIRDALKVVENPRVRQAIKLRLGNEYQAAIRPWMKDQIPSSHADIQGAKFFERFLDGTRINMSAAVLGISYSTGVAQALGLGYAAGVLGEGNVKDGAKWMAAGMAKMLKLQTKGMAGAQEFVFARSDEMKRRAHEVSQESSEVFRKLKDNDNYYRKAQALAFWHIGFIDLNTVSIPTWLGAYEKAKAQGLTEIEASAYGDKAVRLSQGGGRKKDLAGIQRGNAGQKFIAMFYTPSSVFFNQQWQAVQHIKAGSWSKAIAPTFWFLIVTTLLDAMRDGDWPDEGDDEELDPGDVAKWVARNLFFGMFYSVPFARDVSNTGERLIRGEYAEWGSTPITALASSVVKGSKSVYDATQGEEVEGKDIKNIASAVGFVFGLPGNQIGKTTGFLRDVQNGTVDPEGIGDWFTGLTSGKLPEEKE